MLFRRSGAAAVAVAMLMVGCEHVEGSPDSGDATDAPNFSGLPQLSAPALAALPAQALDALVDTSPEPEYVRIDFDAGEEWDTAVAGRFRGRLVLTDPTDKPTERFSFPSHDGRSMRELRRFDGGKYASTVLLGSRERVPLGTSSVTRRAVSIQLDFDADWTVDVYTRSDLNTGRRRLMVHEDALWAVEELWAGGALLCNVRLAEAPAVPFANPIADAVLPNWCGPHPDQAGAGGGAASGSGATDRPGAALLERAMGSCETSPQFNRAPEGLRNGGKEQMNRDIEAAHDRYRARFDEAWDEYGQAVTDAKAAYRKSRMESGSLWRAAEGVEFNFTWPPGVSVNPAVPAQAAEFVEGEALDAEQYRDRHRAALSRLRRKQLENEHQLQEDLREIRERERNGEYSEPVEPPKSPNKKPPAGATPDGAGQPTPDINPGDDARARAWLCRYRREQPTQMEQLMAALAPAVGTVCDDPRIQPAAPTAADAAPTPAESLDKCFGGHDGEERQGLGLGGLAAPDTDACADPTTESERLRCEPAKAIPDPDLPGSMVLDLGTVIALQKCPARSCDPV